MSQSQARSSSGVRDLRSMFEKKNEPTNDSSSDRGRSPGDASQSRSPSARKIRSSFVNVDPSGQMDGIGERRESFSGNDQNLQEAKSSVIDELKKRQGSAGKPEVIPEQAVKKNEMTLPERPKEVDNPDKPVSSLEDKAAALRPADPKSTAAVSGAEAVKSKPNSTTAKASKSNGADTKAKPPNLTTASRTSQPTGKVASTVNSPQSPSTSTKPRQSTASNTSRPARTSEASSTNSPPTKSKPRSPTRPVQLPSHLTQATASSAAKHDPDKKDNHKAHAKEGPRAATKPVNLPSRLTAGTASYNAKHEEKSDDQPKGPPKASSSTRTSMASAGTKPRASLASSTTSKRPSDIRNREQPQAEKKTTAPPSEGFLARMMKPTTASANRFGDDHEKPEPKAPPPKTSNAAGRTTKSSSRPSAAHDTTKKTPRPSVGPAKKIEEAVGSKAEAAKDAVEKTFEKSKPTGSSQNPESIGEASKSPKPVEPEEPSERGKHASSNEVAKPEKSGTSKHESASKADPVPKETESKELPQEHKSSAAAPSASVPNAQNPPPSKSLAEPQSKSDASTPSATENTSTEPTKASLPAVEKPTGTVDTPASHDKAPHKESEHVTESINKAPVVPLTETKESYTAHVPAATTSDEAVVKPDIEPKMDPIPMTTEKSEEANADKAAEDYVNEVKRALEEANNNPDAPTTKSEAEGKAEAIQEKTAQQESEHHAGKGLSPTKESLSGPNDGASGLEGTPGFGQKAEADVIR